MEYDAIVWGPYMSTNVDKLDRIQLQAARFITRLQIKRKCMVKRYYLNALWILIPRKSWLLNIMAREIMVILMLLLF